VFVADAGNHRIRKIDPQGFSLGIPCVIGSALFFFFLFACSPCGFVLLSLSWLSVNCCSGNVSTVAGSGSHGGFKDGSPSEACFNWPVGVLLARDGSIIVADYWNHRIRRISPQGVVSSSVSPPSPVFLLTLLLSSFLLVLSFFLSHLSLALSLSLSLSITKSQENFDKPQKHQKKNRSQPQRNKTKTCRAEVVFNVLGPLEPLELHLCTIIDA